MCLCIKGLAYWVFTSKKALHVALNVTKLRPLTKFTTQLRVGAHPEIQDSDPGFGTDGRLDRRSLPAARCRHGFVSSLGAGGRRSVRSSFQREKKTCWPGTWLGEEGGRSRSVFLAGGSATRGGPSVGVYNRIHAVGYRYWIQ